MFSWKGAQSVHPSPSHATLMQLCTHWQLPYKGCCKTWCSGDAGSSAALLLYMQQHVHKPLRRLRHDSYSTFADIFTTALLQAAATGETLLDSDNSKSARTLQKQADKDASKIFRLNQRMQVRQAGLVVSSLVTSLSCILLAWSTASMVAVSPPQLCYIGDPQPLA